MFSVKKNSKKLKLLFSVGLVFLIVAIPILGLFPGKAAAATRTPTSSDYFSYTLGSGNALSICESSNNVIPGLANSGQCDASTPNVPQYAANGGNTFLYMEGIPNARGESYVRYTITVGSDCGSGTLAQEGTSGSSITIQDAQEIQESLDLGSKPTVQCSTTAQLGSGAAGTTGSGGAPSPELQCLNSSSFSLNWLVCPVMESLQSAADVLDNQITSLLSVDVSGSNGYFDQNPTDNTISTTNYELWGSMRVIALSLLVLIALIMIIAQALDIGPFDAYTIRKVLPRILLAVILITFSWELGRFFVKASDDIANGVTQLIALVNHNNNVIQVNPVASDTLGLMGLGAATAGAFLLGPLAVLLLLLSALFALALGFFVILLRRVILVVCVITAPLAFIAFILPGTQRVWKLWRGAFSGALIMFPLITGAIALGRLFASIENNGTSTDVPLVKTLLTFVFYFAPYFFLPKIAQLSGGAMGQVIGAVRNASAGSFERLKKARQNESAKRRQRWFGGTLYGEKLDENGKPVKNLKSRLANMGIGLGTGARGNFGVGEKGKAAITLQKSALVEENLKNVARLRTLGLTDDNANALLALSGGSGSKKHLMEVAMQIKPDLEGASTEELAANAAERARMVATVGTIGVNAGTSQAAMVNYVQNKARATATGDWESFDTAIRGLAGGDQHRYEDISQTIQYYARLAGRPDIGGDWTSDKVVKMRARLQQEGEARGDSEETIRQTIHREVADAITMDVFTKMDVQSIARAHPKALEQMGETLNRKLKSSDVYERTEAAMDLIALQKNISFAVGGGRQVINDMMVAADVDFSKTRAVPVTDNKGNVLMDKDNRPVVRRVPVTLEEQLVNYVNYRGGNFQLDGSGNVIGGTRETSITADDLAANAATYDQATMRDIQNQPPEDPTATGGTPT